MTTPNKEINAMLDYEENKLSCHTKSRHNKEIKIREFLFNKHSMENAARKKTMTRCTSKNSSQSAFSFAIAVTSTHLALVKSVSDKIINLLFKCTQETMKFCLKIK